MASSSSSNDAVADYMQRLYAFDQVRDITANVFTDNRDVKEAVINDNNVDGELWSKNDFVTMENELADDEGRRVSSMHTTSLAVRNSTLTSPLFDPDTGELNNALVVQGNVPVSVYLDQTSAGLDVDIQVALAKQLSFGLDSAAGVMKNCIAAHNVIHSLLLSALLYFRAKIVENGSSLADNEEGKVMAICRIADTLAEISSFIQEAKKVSYNLADEGEAKKNGGASSAVVGEKYIDLTRAKLPANCNFCNVVGHGPTPIVGQFSDRLQKEYITRNDNIVKEKRSAVHKGGLTDIFITRSSEMLQANNSIASKAASAAIQHNYAANTGERSSIECAFKRAKFDSQIGHLMQSYMDSRIRQLEYQQQKQQQKETPRLCEEREDGCRYEIVRDSEQEENEEEEEFEEKSSTDETTESSAVAPPSKTKQKEKDGCLSPERDSANQVEVTTKDNGERINLPDENRGERPNFRITQRIDAKAPQFLVQNLMMQDQLAPPQLKTAAGDTISALPPDYAELTRGPLPLISPIHSPVPQRQAPAGDTIPALPPDYAELTRGPLPFISPIHSPVPQRQAPAGDTIPALPPDYAELTRGPLPLISPIHSPTLQRQSPVTIPALPPDYARKMKPLSLASPIRSSPSTALVGSVLEPSQSETERVASEIRRLEMMGYSPSLPAIRGRDRQNRASVRTAVKKCSPRRRYK